MTGISNAGNSKADPSHEALLKDPTAGRAPGEKHQPLLVFTLDEIRYGLPLSAVERVLRIVEITPLPQAPEIVQGIVNVEGRIVPVVDIRRRFKLPACAVRLSDQLVLARTSRRRLALRVDLAEGLTECAENEITSAGSLLPGLEYLRGVVKLEKGMVLIHDLDAFLSLDEEEALEAALQGGEA